MHALVFADPMLFLSTLSLRRATRLPTALRTPHQRFLSTLSLRRATLNQIPPRRFHYHFYPRSPCGERHTWKKVNPNPKVFLSTLSLRRATYDTYAKVLRVNISIHALLAESDLKILRTIRATKNFYPRSPCGERQEYNQQHNEELQFLSTLSLRRATDHHHGLKSE